MTKIATLLSAFLFSFLANAQPPVIRSFSPMAAPAGAPVTIKGSRFKTDAAANTVYFGTVKATVTAATDSSLVAIVPAGSIYMPIMVQVDTFTAFSMLPFITSYGSNLQLRNNSFDDLKKIASARIPCFADFDNDGRVDMAAVAPNNKFVAYRNIDSAGFASLQAGTTYAAPVNTLHIMAADFDGDGKLDVAMAGVSSAVIPVYRNTSSNGNISFDAPVYYLLSGDNYPRTVEANDMNGDGKADLVISFDHQGTCFSVARSTSSPGNISFAARLNFAFGSVPGGSGNVGDGNKIYVADIDGDGKPDVTSLSRFFPPFLIYRNTSTAGNISFAPKVSITSNRNTTIGNGQYDMKLADINGDNRLDIVYASTDSSYVSIYLNNSSPANILFASKLNIPGPYYPACVGTNDINGDGKVDIVVIGYDSVYVFENNSTTGGVALQPMRAYPGDDFTFEIALPDIDNDGKADIVFSGYDPNDNKTSAWLLQNRMDEARPLALCSGSDSIVIEPGIRGNHYQWQIDTGSGFVNITDDSVYHGTAAASLVLYHPPSSWSGFRFRCIADDVNGPEQYLQFRSIWTGTSGSTWENPLNWTCGRIPDTNTEVIIKNSNVTVNSNVQVKSVYVSPGAGITVRPGFSIQVSR